VAVGVDDGSNTLGSPMTILSAVDRAAGQQKNLGILFHHEVFVGGEGETFMAKFLDGLQRRPNVSFHTISDLHHQLAGRRG
jgi:hypothetical protein